jgi:hypothetical protein
MSVTVTNTRRTAWLPKWGPAGSQYDFGGVDKVTPDLRLVTSPITIGTTGKAVLGQRIDALEGTVTVEAREITRAMMEEMLPWHSSGDSISLIPSTLNTDLYDYAQLLTLHPKDVASNVFTQDINLLKAVPLYRPMDADGKEDNKVIVTFIFFPDRSVIDTALAYGYVGPVPT